MSTKNGNNIRLRAWRLWKLWSLRDLADRSGCAKKTLVYLENPDKYGHTPQYVTLRKLARALGCSARDLFEDPEVVHARKARERRARDRARAAAE